MTDGAQQALRRIMEIYSKTTRFALACNASDKIIEPIQSRCAVLRYSKLTDGQILARLQEVVEKERLAVSDDGLEAVIFTAQGDMRQVRGRSQERGSEARRVSVLTAPVLLLLQALNNLQSTNSGFGYINSENVFKVCDEPHPLLVKSMLGHCVEGNIDAAYQVVEQLWALGYSPEDIIGNIFRVCKTYQMAEFLKLEFIKVRLLLLFWLVGSGRGRVQSAASTCSVAPQEIGFTHMRVAEGVNSLLQMAGLLGRLCSKTAPPAAS